MNSMKKIGYLLLLFVFLGYFSFSWGQSVGVSTIVKSSGKSIGNFIDDAAKPFAKNSADDVARVTGKAVVIGGNSRILAARISTPNGYAAHHLIPIQMNEHRVLQKIGMDLDEARNGISLPMYPGINPKLPLHRGSHPEYSVSVKKQLDEIPDDLSVAETRRRLDLVQDKLRAELESGKPLHAKFGGEW